MVGIGGGIPPNVRLGDVVVSCAINENPAVVQWDMGKTEKDGKFKRTGVLNSPPTALLTALSKFNATPAESRAKMLGYINHLKTRDGVPESFIRSDLHKDVLYKRSYSHVNRISATDDEDDFGPEEDDCRLCDGRMIVDRPPRKEEITIHYGLIASGNQVIKDAQFRNKLNKDFNGNVLCVEMEAAGLMNDFPCIVIRGICDYADSHKNKVWQEYAAATAAAYAKALLTVLPVSDVDNMQTIKGNFIESARNLISPLWGNKIKEAVSVPASPEMTQAEDRSKDQSYQMPLNLTATQPQPETDITRGQTKIKDVYIAVMGVTGAGKSSFISMCTGKDVKIGHELKSCTTDVEDVTFMLNNGVCVHLIDTPGFDDTYRSDTQVLQEIALWFSKSFKQGTKLSGMVFLHRITDVRMTGSARRNLIMFQKLCGEKVYSSVVLATTMWGLIDETTGAHRERELTESEEFWGYMHKKGSRIFRLAQTRDSCLGIIRHILSFDSTIVLELQDEIVNQGHQLEDTKAGVQLNEDIIREREKHQAELLAMKEQMQEAIALHDAELQRVFREECDKLEENIRLSEEEQAKLKQDLKDVQARKDREFLEFKKQMEADRERENKKNEDKIRHMEELLSRSQKEADRERENKKNEDRIRHLEELLSRSQKEVLEWQAKKHFDREMAPPAQPERNKKYVYVDNVLLHDATRNGKADVAEVHLLESPFQPRVNIEAKNEITPLHKAAWSGKTDVVKRLLDLGADIEARNKHDNTPLHDAARSGKTDMVKLLLDRGADIEAKNKRNNTPLHDAAQSGKSDMVKLLLDQGANMEAKGNNGNVPLHDAAWNGKANVVRLLLGQGANIGVEDNNGDSPLHLAVKNGKADVVKLLVDQGANIEAKDKHGDTSLHIAAWNGEEDAVRLLLSQGADTKARNRQDKTPFHLALQNGKPDVAKLLFNQGLKAKNNDSTPFHLAAQNGKADVPRLLHVRGRFVLEE
ncbi:hypothetical protein ACHAQJ_005039 [Trichoderma viride]